MSSSPFQPAYDALPETLPIFPLPGVLLLPASRLPLNIFEPRYLRMVSAALGRGRMLGMIQPSHASSDGEHEEKPDLFQVGCAGRIVSFQETDDGRLLIVLEGVSRFQVRREEEMEEGFRIVRPDWTTFRGDLGGSETTNHRDQLIEAVPAFFKHQGISADWEQVQAADDQQLVNTLAMFCPFNPTEKQALLEAPDVNARSELLLTLMQMAMNQPSEPNRSKH